MQTIIATLIFTPKGPRLPLDLWLHNIRTRRALRRLSDAQLTDIGLSRLAAQREARLFFWQ